MTSKIPGSPPNECFMVVLKTRLQKQSTYKRSWVVLKRRRPLYQILTFFCWSPQLLLNKSQHQREIMHDTCTSKHRRLHNHPIASHFKGPLFKLDIKKKGRKSLCRNYNEFYDLVYLQFFDDRNKSSSTFNEFRVTPGFSIPFLNEIKRASPLV